MRELLSDDSRALKAEPRDFEVSSPMARDNEEKEMVNNKKLRFLPP